MAAHLTVSVELISFMKWILKHRKSEFKAFIKETLRDGLCDEIAAIAHNPTHDVASSDLYEVVNDFLAYIEDEIVEDMTDRFMLREENPQKAEEKSEQYTEHYATEEDLYRSLDAKTRTQLQTFSTDGHVLSHSMIEAAHMLNSNEEIVTEAARKKALMRALLDNWSPKETNEIN